MIASTDGDGLVLGFQRVLGGQRTLVLINYGEQPATVQVPGLPAGLRLRSAFPRGGAALRATPGSTAVTLPPQQVQVYTAGRAPAD